MISKMELAKSEAERKWKKISKGYKYVVRTEKNGRTTNYRSLDQFEISVRHKNEPNLRGLSACTIILDKVVTTKVIVDKMKL